MLNKLVNIIKKATVKKAVVVEKVVACVPKPIPIKVAEFQYKTRVAVKVSSLDVPLQKYGAHYVSGGFKFAEEHILILNCVRDGKYSQYINYQDSKGIHSASLDNNFLLTPLSSEDEDKLLATTAASTIANLEQHLPYCFSVGSDPEIFLEKKDGSVLPAFDFLPGKEKSVPTTPSRGPNCNLYYDGFQAEFTTEAQSCLAYHVDSIQGGLKAALSHAKNKDTKAKLSLNTVMDISPELMAGSEEKHVAFGCMPSLNAYGLQGIKGNAREILFRSAGGHIHFGCGKLDEKTMVKVVKALDAVLGVCCVSFFAKYDNPRRRQMYGLAGEYRLPPHGLEYRTLSNAWLFHPLLAHMVFDLARKAFVFGQKDFLKYWKGNEEETVKCIQECDVELAHTIMERNKDILLKIFGAAYMQYGKEYVKGNSEAAYKAFYDGIDSIVDTKDIAANWLLNGVWTRHSDGEGFKFGRSKLKAIVQDIAVKKTAA